MSLMETQFPLMKCDGNSLFSPLPQCPFCDLLSAEGSDTNERELALGCALGLGPRRPSRLGFQDARAKGPWETFQQEVSRSPEQIPKITSLASPEFYLYIQSGTHPAGAGAI